MKVQDVVQRHDEWADGIRECPRCQCCSVTWYLCNGCDGEGEVSRYDEDPLYYSDDELFPCEECNGMKGWSVCLGNCDKDGKHDAPW